VKVCGKLGGDEGIKSTRGANFGCKFSWGGSEIGVCWFCIGFIGAELSLTEFMLYFIFNS